MCHNTVFSGTVGKESLKNGAYNKLCFSTCISLNKALAICVFTKLKRFYRSQELLLPYVLILFFLLCFQPLTGSVAVTSLLWLVVFMFVITIKLTTHSLSAASSKEAYGRENAQLL